MKTLITLITLLMLGTLSVNAQQPVNNPEQTQGHVIPKPPAEEQQEITVVMPHKDPSVIQSSGKSYSGRELSRMARKDVNGVAGTVAGVEYTPGVGMPSIRGGGAAGTAYFVDGVRSYGALPVISR